MTKEGGPYTAVATRDLNEHQVEVTMRNASGHEVFYHIYKKSFSERVDQPVKKARRAEAGKQTADALIEMVHMMYQKQTARGFLKALTLRLEERTREFYV